MSEIQTSSVDLFYQFSPKFREIKWAPAGFHIREASARFYFCPNEKGGYSWYNHPYIDIKVAGLDFTFKFEPENELDPTAQMLYSCWNAIMTGPFAERTFYADPPAEEIENYFRSRSEGRHSGDIPIELSYDGAEISGLHLPLNMSAKGWGFFIPHNSPEGVAIVAAIEVEQAQYEEKAQTRAMAEGSGIDTLQAQLDEALSAIPA